MSNSGESSRDDNDDGYTLWTFERLNLGAFGRPQSVATRIASPPHPPVRSRSSPIRSPTSSPAASSGSSYEQSSASAAVYTASGRLSAPPSRLGFKHLSDASDSEQSDHASDASSEVPDTQQHRPSATSALVPPDEKAANAMGQVGFEKTFLETASPRFTSRVLARAVQTGWTADEPFIERVLGAMSQSLQIQETKGSKFEWRYKAPGEQDWTQCFPHRGAENKLTRHFVEITNQFLEHAAMLSSASPGPSTQQDHPDAKPPWQNACDGARFLLWEEEPITPRKRWHVPITTTYSRSSSLGQGLPDILVVPSSVFIRVEGARDELLRLKAANAPEAELKRQIKAARVFADECLVIEAKVSPAPKGMEHAFASNLFKNAFIKANVLSTGDLWFMLLGGSHVQVVLFNAGLVVRCHTVDATSRPIEFLQTMLMIATKGMSLQLPAAEGKVSNAPNSDIPLLSRHTLAAVQHPDTEHHARLIRPAFLHPGGLIRFKEWDCKEQRSIDRIGFVQVKGQVTSREVRCFGGARGIDHRPLGKHTDVYVVRAHVTSSAVPEGVLEGHFAIKTCNLRRECLGREVQNLYKIRANPNITTSVKLRLPEVLACGIAELCKGDPIRAVFEEVSSSHVTGADIQQDELWEHAKSSIRDMFVTVYKSETHALSTLETRHCLAAVADVACTFAYLWKEAEGFGHRDVSPDNLACRLPASQLAAKDTQIQEHLRRQLCMLQTAATDPKTPWWKDWAQEQHGPGPLCIIMDPENATFSRLDRSDQEQERKATWSATVAYWTQLNWETWHNRRADLPHTVAEDQESLLWVVISLLTMVRARERGRSNRGWEDLSHEEIRAAVEGPPDVLKARLAQDDLLGSEHPLMPLISQWRQKHDVFLLERKLWRRKEDISVLPMSALRTRLHEDAEMTAKLDRLLLEVATIATQMALQAFETPRTASVDSPQ